MYVNDIEGQGIEITNLEAAIQQAEQCRHFRHIHKSFAALDKILAEYWNDLYKKLIQLRN